MKKKFNLYYYFRHVNPKNNSLITLYDKEDFGFVIAMSQNELCFEQNKEGGIVFHESFPDRYLPRLKSIFEPLNIEIKLISIGRNSDSKHNYKCYVELSDPEIMYFKLKE